MLDRKWYQQHMWEMAMSEDGDEEGLSQILGPKAPPFVTRIRVQQRVTLQAAI